MDALRNEVSEKTQKNSWNKASCSHGAGSGGTIYHTGKTREPDAEHVIEEQGRKISEQLI
ncbi:hypothetical protein GPECTOR_6g893 [Gonium pectorale]|uniref:Uncharacterized protein n=1 Tax=Gonium pectorale TaxID=33097 RepID=A0A150GVZ9_GONPE|nr:hypothetical protein GPECTOR_6g893 [Gonium pectorale]|eukprot:KXZ53974.1 hypothetical protein GPECTOR_6g893 [Gonium pectorale]